MNVPLAIATVALVTASLAVFVTRSLAEARRKAAEVARALVPGDEPRPQYQRVGGRQVLRQLEIRVGFACRGHVALAMFTTASVIERLWRLLANPVRYLLTGRMEW